MQLKISTREDASALSIMDVKKIMEHYFNELFKILSDLYQFF